MRHPRAWVSALFNCGVEFFTFDFRRPALIAFACVVLGALRYFLYPDFVITVLSQEPELRINFKEEIPWQN